MARIEVRLDPEYVPWGHEKHRRKLSNGAMAIMAILLLGLGGGVLYFGIASQSEQTPGADVVVEDTVKAVGGEVLDLPSVDVELRPGYVTVLQPSGVSWFPCESILALTLESGEVLTRAAGSSVRITEDIAGVECNEED